MFVVLEGFEELVVFGEGLISSWFGQVEGAFVEFLSPEGDCFLSFVARVGID